LGKVKRKELVGGLALIGRCGTGKSLMAAAMVEELGYDDNVSRIRTLSGLVLELKESWRNGSTVSESELIQFYTSSVDLLIVDEVGMQRGSDTEALLLFSILDGRYNNMLPTVMISNLPINDFKLAVGERCIDRLKDDNGQIVAFNWESNRK
jgi:DNA replication protein DnaC